ncbi:hypothetical protein [Vulcanisaeta sp. JCM 16161]|uniref:hypothetical protein n=1 Tax=Vulcanisaeta sp. JCM 16161 TaxID=1295372 RepID=UPI000ADED29C|nr:hypothetical protein [Vulcanisaeta sp. JCM 16161]
MDLIERAIEDIQEILRVTKIVPKAVHLYVGPPSEYYQVANEAIRLINEGKTMGETISPSLIGLSIGVWPIRWLISSPGLLMVQYRGG